MNAKQNNNDDLIVTANSGTAFTYKGIKPEDARRECLCGCELQVVKKAVYRPGHDARHVSQIVVDIIEYAEGDKVHHATLAKRVREGLAELQSVRLVGKAAERLMKNLGEQNTEMVLKAATARIEALEEEGDEDA